MSAGPLDALVIGGGVVGAGTALDLVSRGLRVGLVEARDWAFGASGRSSKLIHGGLRHLELFQFGLVKESLRERTLLLDRIAPHLVRRVPFLYPLHHHAIERAYVGAGLLLYDGLARVPGQPRALPHHRHLALRSVKRIAPGLATDRVTGAVQYYDAETDDARYVLTLVRTAAAYGALVANRTSCVELLRDADRVVGARVIDELSGAEHEIRATVVVSAAGVWTDRLLGPLADPDAADPPRPGVASKGIHLVVPRDRIRASTGVVTRAGSSVLFLIPWGRFWIIGTTDTPWREELEHPAATARDIEELLSAVNRHLAAPLTEADVVGCYAGLRPLSSFRPRRAGDVVGSPLSSELRVTAPRRGLVVAAGGSFTTYRVMAARAGDAAGREIGGLIERSVTTRLPLLGAEGYHARWNQRHLLARQAGLPVGRIEHLLNRYGSLADELLVGIAERPSLGRAVPGAEDYLAAEIVYAASHEGALHLTDILGRRTGIAIETRDWGVSAAPFAADLVAEVLGWDERETARQISVYLDRIEAERRSHTMPDDASAAAALTGW
ncbi:glycerol-3-phosphate dehydrogenase/oxidase [Microlunatus ginsengisoli]